MALSRLTTERVLAQIERVIQSNHEFRLNDSVKLNLVHVEMPNGGTGTKRSEINLEKHLINKRAIVRIQNKDDLCLARALVVSIAKIENDSQYKSIVTHRRPMQTRLAHDLHQKAGVPIGSCGIEEVKQFQAYLTDYQINIVSKEHHSSVIFSFLRARLVCVMTKRMRTSTKANTTNYCSSISSASKRMVLTNPTCA
jgi:hypothetical protein